MRTAATKAWLAKSKDLASNKTADPHPEYFTQDNRASKRTEAEDVACVATKKLEVSVVHGHTVITGDLVATMSPCTVVDDNGNPGDFSQGGVTDYYKMLAQNRILFSFFLHLSFLIRDACVLMRGLYLRLGFLMCDVTSCAVKCLLHFELERRGYSMARALLCGFGDTST